MSWRDEVEGNSEFVDFKTTGSFVGTFIGGQFIDGKFGRCLQLLFRDPSGNEKKINTKSKRLAGLIRSVPDNTRIKILRSGEGFDTHYELEVLDKPNMDNLKEKQEQKEKQEIADNFGGTVVKDSVGWE